MAVAPLERKVEAWRTGVPGRSPDNRSYPDYVGTRRRGRSSIIVGVTPTRGAGTDRDHGHHGDFTRQVGKVISSLRPGEVTTYGEVAEEAGFAGAARAVGSLLARSDGSLPWWRVVTSTGRLVPGFEAEHQRRLEREGVAVHAGRVVATPRRAAAAARTSGRRRRGDL